MTEDFEFKDFFNSESVRPLLPSKAAGIAAQSFALSSPILTLMGVSKSKQEEFAEEVSQISVSESFVDEFSDELGTPRPGESEEAFVSRAKTVLREALRRKFRSL